MGNTQLKSQVAREKDPKQWKEQVLEHPAPSQTRMQGPREGRPVGSLEAVARSRSEAQPPRSCSHKMVA